ncbi:AraC family transcriptional regulator [Rhodobacter xanthinilyticus]|uniref:AraC family transcriptional regulator n=1 Tax=Rhodobacter xanthinilyticus TaxID=1850250 RepID=A0A1D9MCN2_9RHOB|nr:AraC family transcriptional regulator [Rhodobacter xanthinilyticus]AOZ69563.1 AraC family transcriptional regulator [Rhodobacter xanthinilyticus]
MLPRRTIAPGFVEDALAALIAAGGAPEAVLGPLGLTAPVSHPISHELYGRLWRRIARAIGCEFFGLGARPMRPGAFALMAQAALHAPSLEAALRRMLEFLTIVLDAPAGRLTQAEGRATITLSGPAPRSAFADRTYWLIVMGLACWLTGRRIALAQVDFACAAPPDRGDYRQFFGAPVRFEAEVSALGFDARYLALAPIRSEAALGAFLREAPGNLLVRYRHDQGISGQIRARLRSLPAARWPSHETAARDLGLSPATLRRRLAAEGQSFAAIRDELRARRAEEMLRDGALGIAQIAAELGYSEPSAFHRAFRGWRGTSPAAFRAAQAQQHPAPQEPPSAAVSP